MAQKNVSLKRVDMNALKGKSPILNLQRDRLKQSINFLEILIPIAIDCYSDILIFTNLNFLPGIYSFDAN